MLSHSPISARRENDARLSVLVIAEMCNPQWTSVPLVGYFMTRALAEHRDLSVTLATHIRNQSALANDPINSVAKIQYIDNEFIAGPMHRLAKMLRGGQKLAWTIDTALMWPAYVVFEKMVRSQFNRDLERGRFDLIHRVTPLTPTIPSPIAARTQVPMILGPLNGGLPWPKQHPNLRRREREWLAPVRRAYRMLPYFRSTYRHVAGVIAGSRHTEAELPRYFRGPRLYLPENGVDPGRFPIATHWAEPKGPFRFVTVGRLVPYKGIRFIVEAMAGSDLLRKCELVICGDGPERATIEALAREKGLIDSIRLLGWMEHSAIRDELARSQAFVLPSLREFGGGVVLEAMATALPTIVVDYGGPGELVTPECGIRLPMAGPEELIVSLRQAMEGLAGNADRCRRMGLAAAHIVSEEHVWSAKAQRVVNFYREVLHHRTPAQGRSSHA